MKLTTLHPCERGLTMVELVVAAGLLALLLAGLFKLLRDFLTVWEKSEARRAQVEEATGVTELFAADFAALEAGPRGDLVAEWAFFDTDGDGTSDAKWPRVRLVRHASPAELARLQAAEEEKLVGEGLIEVVWAALPAQAGSKNKDLLAEGSLWRGERVAGPARGADVSFFDPKFLSSSGVPRPGATEEVTSGCLWIGMQFATQTSIVRERWNPGFEIEDVLASWDAWQRERPNAERHVWNQPAKFLPPARDNAVLPRRMRLEVEFEQHKELKLRTRVAVYVGVQDGGVSVDDPLRAPEAGNYVLIDREWMQLQSVTGSTLNLRRGQRGTQPAAHDVGALVHYGKTVVREIAIPAAQEDWDL